MPDSRGASWFSINSCRANTGKILLAVCLLVFAGALGAPATHAREVRLIPQWVPQAQFAGYYMGLEKGFYKKRDIDLTIIAGGPLKQSSEYLASGKAEFATLWLASGIQMRDHAVPVVNIAQMVRRSALMLVAKKSTGIRTPQDLNGKKVGLWEPVFQIQPTAFIEKYGLDVTIVRQSYSVNLFLRGGVDVASAMWYNEYHTILNAGLDPDDLVTFFFHEHGLNFPEDGIYVLEDTFNQDPEMCQAFVAASIEGWRYAFAHPEETIDLVMKNLKAEHIPATRVHQKWMLERMQDLMYPAGEVFTPGELKYEDYARVAYALQDFGLINSVPDYNTFYRKCYDDTQK
ncbi:MAG: ABC transporter substrate-binding protein [Desulfatibacillum sp.]|nr:ABC transporter substrate-binding protein [Desulfatibacillum sp.]